jgi:rfaE bifunctional protein kinase chain/domain/rfaE bifunctional protein nucleotidyltransferase chain/domain
MEKKILPIEKLQKFLNKEKKKGKKIVLCHGVFDLLHIGHIKHFKEAKSLGDILVVTLTPDIYVNKGPKRPAFNEKLRIEAVASLDVVDYVTLNSTPTALNIIKKIKPNIYCKGPDYKDHKKDVSGQIKKEINMVKKIGGKIVYTGDITFSSSKIINDYDGSRSNLQKQLAKRINKNYSFREIRKFIEDFKKIKVLIIGETIIDQYVFCEALGKSGKEPVLVLRDLKTEEYLGGAAALSRHISTFCNKISLLSMLGENSEYLKQIKKKLPKNVSFKYIKKENSPTILKRRFLDSVSKNKVLGVYKINDDILNNKQDKQLYKILKNMLPNYDLVIVSDYGHGFISNKTSKLICKLSKYLAINAQVNAANRGYHSMRNYKNVNCVIINETEMRHELRNRNVKAEVLMKRLSYEQNIKNLVVTKGDQGSILYNKKNNKFYYCDAYAKTAIDKIGAGDAMLAIISLCLKYGLNKDLSLLIGSLAGAHSVETLGNKETVNKTQILKSLESTLK